MARWRRSRTWPRRLPGAAADAGRRRAYGAVAGDGRRGRPRRARFADPARFSLAHGGKDRHPYPVPIKVYDETIRVLKSAVQNAKLGREEELQTLRRLDDQARQLEKTANGPSFEDFFDAELKASPALEGRSVFGWEGDLGASRSLPVK
jgi:hypothetical protein